MSSPSGPPVNLKQVFMELGNKLVTEHGFEPCNVPLEGRESFEQIREYNQRRLNDMFLFTEWLNQIPEARQILGEMGIYWPVVEECDHKWIVHDHDDGGFSYHCPKCRARRPGRPER